MDRAGRPADPRQHGWHEPLDSWSYENWGGFGSVDLEGVPCAHILNFSVQRAPITTDFSRFNDCEIVAPEALRCIGLEAAFTLCGMVQTTNMSAEAIGQALMAYLQLAPTARKGVYEKWSRRSADD